jgi:Fe-S cluster biogenesis protein NfuA
MPDEDQFAHSAERIEELVANLERSTDPAARAGARELVQALMDVHGAALERMLEIISRVDDRVKRAVADDPLVSSLLLLYGLHPDDLDTRVNRATERMRQYVCKHGGEIGEISITETKISVRLETSGCQSTAHTLKSAIEDAIRAAAPDVAEIEVKDLSEEASNSGFVPLGDLQLKPLAHAEKIGTD